MVMGSEGSLRRCLGRLLHLEAHRTSVALVTQLDPPGGQDRHLYTVREREGMHL